MFQRTTKRRRRRRSCSGRLAVSQKVRNFSIAHRVTDLLFRECAHNFRERITCREKRARAVKIDRFAQWKDRALHAAHNRRSLRNNAKKLRVVASRCIPVHYSNCPTGTQQCVEMHRHCSKVFKKRDPAINPMNMGSRRPPENNLRTRHVSQAQTSNVCRTMPHPRIFRLFSARMMRHASASSRRRNDGVLTPRWSRRSRGDSRWLDARADV